MKSMSGRCKAIVFRCIDFRITLTEFSKILSGMGYPEGTYDLVSCAGAIKSMATNEDRGFLLKQIEAAKKLHGVTEVLIFQHDNCGAYGIPSVSEEEGTQKKHLKEVARIIGTAVLVKTFIIQGTKTGTLYIKEIF